MDQSEAAPSSSDLGRLRERRKQSEPLTLHTATLRQLELEAEEFVLALTKGSNPLGYVLLVLKAWFRDGLAPLSPHGFSTSSYNLESPGLEISDHPSGRHFQLSLLAVFSIFFLKSVLYVAKPVEVLGDTFEYYLNIMYANHGLKNTLYTCLFNRELLRKPISGDDNYYSITTLLDPRQELQLSEGIDVSILQTDAGIKIMADICIMASKISYENEKVIKKVVEESWKMNFVQFFDGWNDYLEYNSTQAFIFTDKKEDANIVVVAFRGTQPFNMYDWCTDFDFSYYVLPEIGRVHVGFLEALGLASRLRRDTLKKAKINTIKKAKKQSPSHASTTGLQVKPVSDGGKQLAYDAICAVVRTLLGQNKRAKLYVTGHSLGGALATLFSALLLIEEDEACSRLGGVFTFGQPRVGDARFARYMEKSLCETSPKKYFRVVYRTDIVARLPFDDRLFQFKHIAPCHFYESSSKSLALAEEPYNEFIWLILQPLPHFNAMKELYTSLLSRLRGRERGYVETGLALMMRGVALIFPGLCAHFPSCYLDAVRGAPSSFLLQAANLEKKTFLAFEKISRLKMFNWSIFFCVFVFCCMICVVGF